MSALSPGEQEVCMCSSSAVGVGKDPQNKTLKKSN